jgi:hypothetical protein
LGDVVVVVVVVVVVAVAVALDYGLDDGVFETGWGTKRVKTNLVFELILCRVCRYV